jgi:hypothetical protein
MQSSRAAVQQPHTGSRLRRPHVIVRHFRRNAEMPRRGRKAAESDGPVEHGHADKAIHDANPKLGFGVTSAKRR